MREDIKQDLPRLPSIIYVLMIFIMCSVIMTIVALSSKKQTISNYHKNRIMSNITFLENADSLENLK